MFSDFYIYSCTEGWWSDIVLIEDRLSEFESYDYDVIVIGASGQDLEQQLSLLAKALIPQLSVNHYSVKPTL